MTKKLYSHANFGNSARVELCDNEVAVVFVANSKEQARELATDIMESLKMGDLRLTLSGEPLACIDLDDEYGRPN